MMRGLSFIAELSDAIEDADASGALREAFGRLSENEHFSQFITHARSVLRMGIWLERDGMSLGEHVFSPESQSHVWKDLVPGRYALHLSSGRQLWDAALTEEDLIWEKAFPSRELPMAAATGDTNEPASRTEALEETFLLSVWPGLSTGRIELELLDKAS